MAEVKSEQESVEESEEEVRTFLVVRAASPPDWGVYTCRADNNIANNEAAVVLKGDKNQHLISLSSNRIFRISPTTTEKSKEKIKVVLQRTGEKDLGEDNFCNGKLSEC